MNNLVFGPWKLKKTNLRDRKTTLFSCQVKILKLYQKKNKNKNPEISILNHLAFKNNLLGFAFSSLKFNKNFLVWTQENKPKNTQAWKTDDDRKGFREAGNKESRGGSEVENKENDQKLQMQRKLVERKLEFLLSFFFLSDLTRTLAFYSSTSIFAYITSSTRFCPPKTSKFHCSNPLFSWLI